MADETAYGEELNIEESDRKLVETGSAGKSIRIALS